MADIQVVLEKDIDFVVFSPIYRCRDGSLIAHSNWFRDVPNIPNNLTVVIKNNRIVEIYPELQDAWVTRYHRMGNRGMARDKTIAYMEVKINAIILALGASHDS